MSLFQKQGPSHLWGPARLIPTPTVHWGQGSGSGEIGTAGGGQAGEIPTSRQLNLRPEAPGGGRGGGQGDAIARQSSPTQGFQTNTEALTSILS